AAPACPPPPPAPGLDGAEPVHPVKRNITVRADVANARTFAARLVIFVSSFEGGCRLQFAGTVTGTRTGASSPVPDSQNWRGMGLPGSRLVRPCALAVPIWLAPAAIVPIAQYASVPALQVALPGQYEVVSGSAPFA